MSEPLLSINTRSKGAARETGIRLSFGEDTHYDLCLNLGPAVSVSVRRLHAPGGFWAYRVGHSSPRGFPCPDVSAMVHGLYRLGIARIGQRCRAFPDWKLFRRRRMNTPPLPPTERPGEGLF